MCCDWVSGEGSPVHAAQPQLAPATWTKTPISCLVVPRWRLGEGLRNVTLDLPQ